MKALAVEQFCQKVCEVCCLKSRGETMVQLANLQKWLYIHVAMLHSYAHWRQNKSGFKNFYVFACMRCLKHVHSIGNWMSDTRWQCSNSSSTRISHPKYAGAHAFAFIVPGNYSSCLSTRRLPAGLTSSWLKRKGTVWAFVFLLPPL